MILYIQGSSRVKAIDIARGAPRSVETGMKLWPRKA